MSNSSQQTLIIAIAVVAIGLSIGAIGATKIWKRKGTISFMSSIASTPELDNDDETKGEAPQKENVR